MMALVKTSFRALPPAVAGRHCDRATCSDRHQTIAVDSRTLQTPRALPRLATSDETNSPCLHSLRTYLICHTNQPVCFLPPMLQRPRGQHDMAPISQPPVGAMESPRLLETAPPASPHRRRHPRQTVPMSGDLSSWDHRRFIWGTAE
jgi:hypothetical protein